jgi:hypothetical protein
VDSIWTVGGTAKYCSKTPIVMGNFNGNVLAQKNAKKGKRPDLKALIEMKEMKIYGIPYPERNDKHH